MKIFIWILIYLCAGALYAGFSEEWKDRDDYDEVLAFSLLKTFAAPLFLMYDIGCVLYKIGMRGKGED